MFKNAEMPKKTISKIVKNIQYNDVILQYYTRFYAENEKNPFKKTIYNKIDNMKNCNKLFRLDVYEKNKIKDFISTNLCRDKFCNNCKKVKQSARMAKYMPELEKFKKNTYHLTLTQPNVSGEDLKDTIKLMSKSFSTLNMYLKGSKQIQGINFSRFGYIGGVRSLEVTFNNNSYHPHYHVLLILKKFKMSKKEIVNTYSYSRNILKNKFSNEEILIQKLWFLLMNKKRLSKKNIDDLDIGYSCKMDKLGENDYNEIFKYMTKSENEDGNILNYENFKYLYESLFNIKQIQGYGVLYNITDNGDLEKMIEDYENVLLELQKKEKPVYAYETPQELLKDEKYLLISRKQYIQFLNNII